MNAGAWANVVGHGRTRGSIPSVLAAGAIGVGALAAGVKIAAHHPLSPALAILAVLALAAASAARERLALFLVPAALPWVGLAPWTGWIVFEEFDLLVLAVAAGGWLRRAFVGAAPPLNGSARPPGGWGALAAVAWTLWCASVAVSAWRGVMDAGGWSFDWFAGYREPMNALRLVKPTVAALLLAPLWREQQRRDDARASRALAVGFALGHAGAALACVWERTAFPGLTNFSTDYRTTALFWEMHVGGAALDGWLVLTAPFVWQRLSRARKPAHVALWTVVAALGAYAALTTFSRIVLVAVPLALGVGAMLGAGARGRADRSDDSTPSGALVLALAAAAVLGLGAALTVFPSSGYRGMLALAGVVALAPAAGAAGARLDTRERLAAGAVALLGAGAAAASLSIAKGPYWADAALLGLTALGLGSGAAIRAASARAPSGLKVLGVGAWTAATAAIVVVARHWGGADAVAPAIGAGLAALAGGAILAVATRPPRPAPALRAQAVFVLALLVGMAVVGMMRGGAYLGSRLQAAASDESGRWRHWRSSLARLPDDGASRVLGAGLGRYLERFAASPDGVGRPGDMRRVVVDGVPTVRLANGDPPVGWGELLRLSQRIGPLAGPATLVVRARGVPAAGLHVEVCTKHLLYDDGCRVANAAFTAPAERWQTLTIRLDGAPIGQPQSGLPRWSVLSLAAADANQLVEIRSVSLVDAQGRERVSNADFGDGLARWFITSDRNHMPWHAKNITVHLLFEQGIAGAAAMVALLAAALGATVAARRHPLAGPAAGAIVGFVAVGAIDSLLDMPRPTAAFLLLLAVAPTLRAPPAGVAGTAQAGSAARRLAHTPTWGDAAGGHARATTS